MSTEAPPHSGSDEESSTDEESVTRESSWSNTVSNFLFSVKGALTVLITLLMAIFTIIIITQYKIDLTTLSNSPYDLLVVSIGGILLGGSLMRMRIERSEGKSLQDHKQKINIIESKIDRLANVTSTADGVPATENKLEMLISAAEDGKLGENLQSNQITDVQNNNSKPEVHSISVVLNQMGSHRLPPKETPAREFIDQIKTYEPDNRGALKDAIERLKDQAEDVQLLEKTFVSTNKELVVSRNPSKHEFTTSLKSLNAAYDSLDTSPGGRAPTLTREQVKNFVKSNKKIVKNFQSYFDRHQIDDSRLNLQAASQIESDPSVNLVPSTTAKLLIDDLQNQEDGRQVKRRLQQAIGEMNSYRSVRSSLDTEEELRRELNSLSESTNTLQVPVADIFQQKVNDVEQLFSRSSLNQMDDVQRIALQERISVLTDIVAELNQISRYQDGALSKELESLDQEINNFVSRYIDSREWGHYNHSISNQYVSLAQEFHGNASEAAGRDDTRARAFVEAGRRTLELTEQLYQKPKFTSLLDPTID